MFCVCVCVCVCVCADRLQSINYGIEDGTLSDIEEATKSKYYEYDSDWESRRKGLLLQYYLFLRNFIKYYEILLQPFCTCTLLYNY